MHQGCLHAEMVLKTGRSGGNAAVFGWVVGALCMSIVRVYELIVCKSDL